MSLDHLLLPLRLVGLCMVIWGLWKASKILLGKD